MKIDCPRCGGHVYADGQTAGQKVECTVCRHRFAVVSADQSLPAGTTAQPIFIDAVPAKSDQVENQAAELTSATLSENPDRARLASGLRVTAWSWALLYLCSASLILSLTTVLVINRRQMNPLAANEVLYQFQLGVTLICGMAYVWGQWMCFSACQQGGVLRLAMKKTLRNWGFAAATRVLAFALAFPALRIVGAVFAARSFTAFLAFLSILATVVERPDVARQVHALDRLYRRSLGLTIALIVSAMLLQPGVMGIMLILLGAVVTFVASMTVFAWQKAAILFRLSMQLRQTSCQKG